MHRPATRFFTLVLAFAAGCTSPGVPGGQPEASGGAAAGPVPGAPLENTDWKLLELGGRPVRASADAAGPDLRLDPAQKQAGGNAGCNRFFGPYELSGQSLRLGPLASTRRACLDPEMNRQEAAFLQALGDTRTWRITADTLVLAGEAGPVARFVAQSGR
jgi:heat shock protein HslJ